jgi:uncharacterized protein (DUF433 family)
MLSSSIENVTTGENMVTNLPINSLNLQDYFEIIPSVGQVRIKGHRLGIEHIVKYFHEGYPPEQIAQHFPGVSLEKIYATLTYYLHHRTEIDDYLTQLEKWVQQRMHEDDMKPAPPVVQRLRARRSLQQGALVK